jgi:ATP-dependent Lhr-like helicase
MDIAGLENLLRALESGEARIVARDLTAPSPLAAEILGARPYAFLDDAPLEERRTQAVQSRRWADPESADDLGRLDADAIAAVREEAWPEARDADELHDALMGIAFVTDAEATHAAGWSVLLMQLIEQRRATHLHLGESPALWIAAERLPLFQALHPHATFDPAIVAPAEFAEIPWTREEALVDILRARLTGLGPTTVEEIAASLMVASKDVELALLRLEADGHVMRGRFTPDAENEQWCERHLLARIHRYTLGRLRREIEPVEPRDFMRFLFDWQRVAQGSQGAGPDTLAATLAQLEGFEAAAGAWESELLPARVADYDIAWLDELSMTGRIVWTRLRAASQAARAGAAGPLRSTPIVLLPRQRLALWTALTAEAADTVTPSSRAQLVADWLRTHGASFFDELVDGTRLLRTELENALAELVAFGLINADSFAGLRALLTPASKRPARHHRSRRPALWGIQDAGRWALLRKQTLQTEQVRPQRGETNPETLDPIARTLLRRYGVVAWRVLEREAAWLPPWRELRRVYHRLEARGEIRGGRFIAGIAGEQFALPEAIGLLRSVRQRAHDGSLVCASGSDPLNQLGTLLPGPRLPALTGARVLYRDGVPIATLVSGEVALLETMDDSAAWVARKQLLRDHAAHALPVDVDVADADVADSEADS